MSGAGLTVSGVGKSFGARAVLRDVSFSAAPGEFVAVIGKSGCGKSTLLRLIAGLDTADCGVIAADHQPVCGLSRETLVLFQEPRLLPWRRVIDNVGLGLPPGWRVDAQRMLAHVGLQDHARDWPLTLSGGQRQRAALARALIRHPRLMLFDEPLGALDALTRLEMQGMIEKLWQEQQFTALLITHDVEEAVALADRVLLLKDGRIILNQPITLTRPRLRSGESFVELKEKILAEVMSSGVASAPFVYRV
jgi:sulfonate transport system ATP-binding protein